MYLQSLFESFSKEITKSFIVHRNTQEIFPTSLEVYNNQKVLNNKVIYITDEKNIYSFLSKAKKLSRSTVFVSAYYDFYYNEMLYPNIDIIVASLPIEVILSELSKNVLEFSRFNSDCQNAVIHENSEMVILDLLASNLECCALLLNDDNKIHLCANRLQTSSMLAKGTKTGQLILPKSVDLNELSENITVVIQESKSSKIYFRKIRRSSGRDNTILIVCTSSKTDDGKARDHIYTAASNIVNLYERSYSSNVLGSSKLVQLIDYVSVAHQPDAAILREKIRNLEKPAFRFFTNILIQRDSDSDKSFQEIIEAVQNHFPDCNIAIYNGIVVVLYTKNKVFFRTELDTPELHKLMKDLGCKVLLNNAISNWTNYYINLTLGNDSLQILSVISSDDPSRRVYHLDEMGAMLTFNSLIDNLRSKGFNDDAFLYFSTPNITHLAVYEQIYNENLVDVLYEYLINGRNILKTSTALYMHRNTVYNKIKKIKASIPMDIDDPNNMFILLFSCMTLKFYKRYLKRPIPATIGEDNTLTSLWPTDYINISERGI